MDAFLPPLPAEPIVPPALIPPILADPQNAFIWVLTHIIGLETPAKRDRVTVRGGVTNAIDLIMIDMEQLLDQLTDNTTVMAKTKLQTLKVWAEEQYDTYHEIHLADFTNDVCRNYQLKYLRSKERTKSKSDTPTSSKEKLRVFNGKNENWLNAKRELSAYLNQIVNNDGVPLYYVIRDPTQENEYRTSNGELGNRIYDAPFRGRTLHCQPTSSKSPQ
jgi:hypothetical protein